MSLTLHKMQRDLKGFDIREEVRQSIVTTSDDITAANKSQLWEGTNAESAEITPFYTEYTTLVKDLKGQPSDRVTLKDTGAFYKSIKVDVKTDTFEILATDHKSDKLQDKYGKSILGMTDDNHSKYVQYSFFPELRGRITGKLGYKFGP